LNEPGRGPTTTNVVEDVLALTQRFSRLPVFDARSPDEIVGYDEHGVPR
jgi:antitoxin VapB